MDVQRSQRVRNFPSTLIVALRRFCFDVTKGEYSKITSELSFPPVMDFSAIADDHAVGDPRYELTGIVAHSGTVDGGHYVAYRRLGARGWVLVDDDRVENVTWSQVAKDTFGGPFGKRCAYVLVFGRRNVGEVEEPPCAAFESARSAVLEANVLARRRQCFFSNDVCSLVGRLADGLESGDLLWPYCLRGFAYSTAISTGADLLERAYLIQTWTIVRDFTAMIAPLCCPQSVAALEWCAKSVGVAMLASPEDATELGKMLISALTRMHVCAFQLLLEVARAADFPAA